MLNLTAVRINKEEKRVTLELTDSSGGVFECPISQTEARAIAHAYKTLFMDPEGKRCGPTGWKPDKPLTDLENH